MIRIEVKSAEVFVKSGTSPRTQRAYNIREQEAWASLFGKDGNPQPYPVRIVISIADVATPYPPGQYQLDPACLYVDRFGGLAIARPRLLPLAPKAVEQSKAA